MSYSPCNNYITLASSLVEVIVITAVFIANYCFVQFMVIGVCCVSV